MKENDIIVFKYEGTTLKYTVCQGIGEYFLTNESGGLNRQIFSLLKIENRFKFCENVIGYPIKDVVDFTVVKTLEDLEKIVNALYQRIIDISIPKFKKEEKVKIVPKDGFKTDYPYIYTQEMEKLANTTDTIVNVNKISIELLKLLISLEKYQEPFTYCLQNNIHIWTSAMLESVNEDKTKKEERPPKFNIGDKVKIKTLDRDHCYGIFLNPEMLRYCDQEFEIRDYIRNTGLRDEKCDGYKYSLKGIGVWVWSSDMLEKSEDKIKIEPDVTIGITSEPCDLSVMQKISAETDHIDTILLPPKLAKTDINTQTITFGNIKTMIDTNYKLNFNVKPLKF